LPPLYYATIANKGIWLLPSKGLLIVDLWFVIYSILRPL
jgi:hypothetical protein